MGVGDLEAAFGHRWGMAAVFGGLRAAIRPGNPALWWPLLVMAASLYALVRWTRRRDLKSLGLLGLVMVLDLAGVVATVDVDWKTYRRDDLAHPPALTRAIRATDPDPGHRLLVPRYQADYDRPIEVLWPETNLRWGVATFNAYGPFWPKANRLLFRFMPWGSSEAVLDLLRNPRLCAAMGIQWVAARTEEERGSLPLPGPQHCRSSRTDRWHRVVGGGSGRGRSARPRATARAGHLSAPPGGDPGPSRSASGLSGWNRRTLEISVSPAA